MIECRCMQWTGMQAWSTLTLCGLRCPPWAPPYLDAPALRRGSKNPLLKVCTPNDPCSAPIVA